MDNADLIAKLETKKAGFKLIQTEAEIALKGLSAGESFLLATEMYHSDIYQARMFATFIFGHFAASNQAAYNFLLERVVYDPDWRTQEMLARAFDQFCKDKGYQDSLSIIEAWLVSPEPNQRRAASEGLRIWTSRPYFKDHPEAAISLLASLRTDPSVYVRKSAGNALRDISKRYPDLIKSELDTWDLTDSAIAFTYKLSAKFITGEP